MIISIALSNFYYWKDEFNSNAEIEYLKMIKELDIDGVELHFTQEELEKEEYKRFAGKLGNLIVTVHLPNHFEMDAIFEQVIDLHKFLKIKHFIIHADMYSKLKSIPDIPIVIENSDIRKKGYQDLKDVALLGMPVCLDINHVEEYLPGKFKEQYHFVKGKIKELHISSLSNPASSGPLYDDCPHHLINGSDYTIPKELPKDVIWVIEGIVPIKRLDLLKKEIKMLREL